MTVLTRFYPYRELNTFQDRVNRVFHESFNGNGSEGRDESLATSSFAPAVDVPPSHRNREVSISGAEDEQDRARHDQQRREM